MCRHKQHIHELPRQLAVLRHLRRMREAEEGEAAEDEKVDGRDIEVEIQDADGGIAKMTIAAKDIKR